MTFKAATCPSCGGALQVPDDRTTVKCMYCGVDVMVRDAIALASGRVKESTPATRRTATKKTDPNAGGYLGCGIALLIFGIVIIAGAHGSSCGGIFFVVGLLFAIIGGVNYNKSVTITTGYTGECPYCESPITIPGNAQTQGGDCPACSKRIVIRGDNFISVDTPVSGVRYDRT